MFIPILFVVAVFAFIFLNGKYNENYWRKRRAPYDTNNKYIGPFFEYIYSKLAVFKILERVYKAYPDAPAVGLATLVRPTLLVKDLTNIQYVVATNFSAFNHPGFEANEGDLLADNILFMSGKRWKLMRQSMTPLFTSTKMKSMYYIMDKSAQDFIDYLKKNPEYLQGNTKKALSTFCSAAIGASVFGVQTQSVFDSPFLKMAQEATVTSNVSKISISFALYGVSSRLSKLFGIKIFKRFENFFIGAIKQIISQRKQDKQKRNDFADICVSLQDRGNLKDFDSGLEIEPTDEVLAAQAFFFFIAGVEPSATSMYATLVELGRHPELLAKVHEEIDRIFEKHSQLSYDVLVEETEYLDMALSEATRLHPPLAFLTRQCVQDTVLPVGNIKVSKGSNLFIPLYQIHHDEKYYPDPDEFKPERFSKENRHKINEAAYFPFGKGNRICVGMRYATIQVKAGLIHLLRNYTVKTTLEGNQIKYKKEIIQMRIINADVELIPRNSI